MPCYAILLRILLALPVWHQDADLSPDARAELYRPVAASICRVGKTPQEQAWLAAQAYSETKLAKAVLEGRCADMPAGSRCDEGRATGVYQVHGHCRNAWTAPTHDERLDAGAKCALRTAKYGVTMCGLAGSFGFQTGRRVCAGDWIGPRVRLYRLILGRMLDAKP
jgi:hypothetical protein